MQTLEWPATAEGRPVLELAAITKSFSGVRALDSVDFDLRAGEVHVLFGENGAGKSTIINIIAGTFPPTSGTYRWCGEPIEPLSSHAARVLGIRPVFQEFSLVDELTVWQNIFLGREISRGPWLRRRHMRELAAAFIAELGFELDPCARVETLDRSRRQMVEIAKALFGNLKVLILDEPSASLTEAETRRLFDLVEKLRASGVAIIYVSHRMAEIRRLADRVTVLRDGRHIATVEAGHVSDDELIQMMTGRPVGMLYPAIRHSPGAVTVEVRNLTLEDGAVADVSIRARAGEVTGIAGLVGCGKSELVRAIFGLHKIRAGEVAIRGIDRTDLSPAASLAAGTCYFPSDRVAEGLALDRPIRENASIAAIGKVPFSVRGVLDLRAEKNAIGRIAERLKLRPPNIEAMTGGLSGGNRQKVVLARGLAEDIEVFLFDEPTVGIDVGAKAEVYEVVRNLVEAGKTVVLVSSDLPEVLALSNRLYVMYRSRIAAELHGDDINEETVLSHFFPAGERADAASRKDMA
jgi:ribose transport system ATP-binding protein